MKGASAPTLALALSVGLFAVPTESQAFLDKLFKKTRPAESSADATSQANAAASSLYREAQMAAAKGNTRAALSGFQKVVDRYPLSPSASSAQFQMGETQLSKGDLDTAFDAFQLLVSNYRQSPEFATAIQRQFEIAEAAKSGERVSSFIGIPMKLTSARIVEMYEAVLGNAPFGPNAPKAQFSIAEIHQDLGRKNQAVAAYQKIVSDYPRTTQAKDAQFRIGQINNITALRSEDVGSIRDAQAAMETFVIENPNAAESEDAQAILSSLQTRDLGKDMEVARFYEKTGKPKAAAIYYQGVVKYPGNEFYEEARDRLLALGEDTSAPAPAAAVASRPAPVRMAESGELMPLPRGDGLTESGVKVQRPKTVITPDGHEVAIKTADVVASDLVKASPRYVGPRAPDLNRLLRKPKPRLSVPSEILALDENPGALPGEADSTGNILLPPPPDGSNEVLIPPAPAE